MPNRITQQSGRFVSILSGKDQTPSNRLTSPWCPPPFKPPSRGAFAPRISDGHFPSIRTIFCVCSLLFLLRGASSSPLSFPFQSYRTRMLPVLLSSSTAVFVFSPEQTILTGLSCPSVFYPTYNLRTIRLSSPLLVKFVPCFPPQVGSMLS